MKNARSVQILSRLNLKTFKKSPYGGYFYDRNNNYLFCNSDIYCICHIYDNCRFYLLLDGQMTTFTSEDRKKGADPYAIADVLEFEIDTAYLDPLDGHVLIQAAYILRMQADRITELERKHKEEFDYVEKLFKDRQ
jgi:hypothetical protein